MTRLSPTATCLPFATLVLAACPAAKDDTASLDDTESETAADSQGDSGGDSGSESDTTSDSGSETGDTASGDCTDAETNAEEVVCAAEAFLATLTSTEQGTVQYDWTDSAAKTEWSNLPPQMVPRPGITFGELSDTSRAAAYTVAAAALSDAGYADFVGVVAADEYLLANGGGSDYGADNYSIAFIGTPSTTGDWMLMIGGHHMAWNITYIAGAGYPTPNHLGSEPKGSFTLDGESYAPVEGEGSALQAIFTGLSSSQLAEAFLDGQVFGDVLLGPDEYGTGSYDAVNFPTGSSRGGLLVSDLDSSQQALVTAAIDQWVGDFDASFADDILAAYTTEEAWTDTYVAWAGSENAGPDVDTEGTYFRIDGPRVWIELACQGGIVIRGETHFHTIFRDKQNDYANSL